MNQKQQAQKVKPIMESLIGLEKQHGTELTHYAMRKRLTFVKEEGQRVKEIKRIEKELAELRGKKDELLRPSKSR